MTINESQELAVLSVFIDNNIGKFSSLTFPPIMWEKLGSGADALIRNMIRDGAITDNSLFAFEYEFNQIGKARYALLKKKRNEERLNGFVLWATLLVALVAAIYAILTYYSTPSPQSRPTPVKGINSIPIKTPQSQTLLPDTTKGHPKPLSGSLK